jgi:HEAT repeat protein
VGSVAMIDFGSGRGLDFARRGWIPIQDSGGFDMAVSFPSLAIQFLRQLFVSISKGDTTLLKNAGSFLMAIGDLLKWFNNEEPWPHDDSPEAAAQADEMLSQYVVEAEALCEELGIPLSAVAGLGNGEILRFLVQQILTKLMDPEFIKLILEILAKKPGSGGLV